jgi:hypothetical protein
VTIKLTLKLEARILEGGIEGEGLEREIFGEEGFEMKGICLRFQPKLRNF